MDFPLAEPVKAALHAAIERDDTGYLGSDLLGVPDALADFAARRLNWELDPEQVVVATDVMVGIEECLGVLTDPGAGVVITPPVYPPFFADVRHVGRRVVEAPLNGGRLDIAAIERGFEAGAQAILLCNPHNPLGRVWSRGELAAVAASPTSTARGRSPTRSTGRSPRLTRRSSRSRIARSRSPAPPRRSTSPA